MLTPGDPVPWFTVHPPDGPGFDFSQVAGHHTIVCFVDAAAPDASDLLSGLGTRWDIFDGKFANLFIVSERPPVAMPSAAGIHLLHDPDGEAGQRFGLDPSRSSDAPISFVLDPRLRVVAIVEAPDAATHQRELTGIVAQQPRLGRRDGGAPVLQVPRVFEPELCAQLIGYFQQVRQQETGFMHHDPVTGRTQHVNDFAFKRRRDCILEDQQLVTAVLDRLGRRLIPEIHKAFQFEVTRVERCIVCRYDAAEGGHFRRHRDNTSTATAHRRFAVTINLNATEYEGGDLAFPEFGNELWRPPTGGAVVFSCSLLHEVKLVTRGTRYCFLPFLFDEPGEQMRLENAKFLQLGALKQG